MITWFGSFEYTVMPFGHCNAPLTFQHFVNDIFTNLVEFYVVVYLDGFVMSRQHLPQRGEGLC
ncbi:hypothetical protein VP01_13919g1 [Puccinia sorghi]|uniref:Reverse transcriptase domain-containing protein n=1 Tax=Puccinia sorghi TaxID=27349 RepID=A0A0L6VN18_9BASI|nr:hypothetical protein VP01_13919g1 [Puccinia sorghi]